MQKEWLKLIKASVLVIPLMRKENLMTFTDIDGKNSPYSDQFAQAFPYTQEDLAKNQNFELSSAQKRRIKSELPSVFRNKLVAALLIMLSILLYQGTAFVLVGSTFQTDYMLPQVILGILSILIGRAAIYRWRNSQPDSQLALDLCQGKVESISGVLEKYEETFVDNNGTHHDYFIKVESQGFPVTCKVYEAIRTRQSLRIYYLPCSRRVMSAELV